MKMTLTDIQISIKPNTIARFLTGVALFLIFASTVGQFLMYFTNFSQYHILVKRLILFFELGFEQNIPTHFSVILLLISAALLAFIYLLKKKQKDWSKSYWLILSAGFLFMSADEAYQLHENLILIVRRFLDSDYYGIFYFAWVIPYFVLVVVLALFFFKFFLNLPSQTKKFFLLAAVIYLGGVMGMELWGGYYAELHGVDSFTYSMLQTVEESLEIAGLIIFIWALLNKISNSHPQVILSFKK